MLSHEPQYLGSADIKLHTYWQWGVIVTYDLKELGGPSISATMRMLPRIGRWVS